MILPFGKYKGKTLDEAGGDYLLWLVAQRRWLRDRYPDIYTAARKRVVANLQQEMVGVGDLV